MDKSSFLLGLLSILALYNVAQSDARISRSQPPPPPPTPPPPPSHRRPSPPPSETDPGDVVINHFSTAVEYNVLNYGALGDSQTDDSQAFSNAWTAACATVAGYVHVPSGYEFKVYPTSFSGPCQVNFTLKVDGTILAPKDPSVWDGLSNFWLKFKKVSMSFQGQGTINGQGQEWWANSCKTNSSNPCVDGPTALVFESCTNVTIKNVVILNSQQMHLALEKSLGIVVNNVIVTAPGNSPNTDGIHLQNSSFVTIKNTMVGTGDDCISIQTGCFNVKIRNVTCGPGHGISVGGLGKKNSSAAVANLVVDTITFKNTTNGVRIKTWQGSSGYATNFSFKNIQMINTKNPILIDQYYCDSGSSGSCPNFTSNVIVSNINYANISGTSTTKAAVQFHCSDTVPCEGININNIDLIQTSGKDATSSCEDAYGSANNTIIPASCLLLDSSINYYPINIV